LNGDVGGLDYQAWTSEVSDIGDTMRATSACGLGMAAPNVTDSLLKYFPELTAAHVGK
jgi:NADH:ubiquinone oxidoreductase subunit F (NADH-binding)